MDFETDITFVQLLIYTFAIASLRSLIITDRITRGPRHWLLRKLHAAGGTIPVYIQWLIGCALCFGFWAALALWSFNENDYVTFGVTVMALRQAAAWLISLLNSDDEYDYPEGVDFPPLEL